MLTLHATLARGDDGVSRFAVWGEDSALPATPARRPGRRPRIQPHPFAASHAALLQVVPTGVTAEPMELTLRLPAQGGGPMPSPELVREEPTGNQGQVTSALWHVSALLVDASGLPLLTGGVDDAAHDVDIARGPSLVHLGELGNLGRDLARRGRLLPGLTAEPPRAVWRPVLTAADAAWARTMCGSAPPVLFSAAEPAESPVEAWAAALDTVVDAVARERMGRSGVRIGRAGSTATRAWLEALTGPDGHVDLDDTQVAGLQDDIGAWQQDIVAGPVRAAFRLTEPAEHSEPVEQSAPWHLSFALQAVEEPSLVVEARQVWTGRKGRTALAGLVDAPQETLLAELGKAARLFPDLDRALRSARPERLELSTEEAHGFLTSVAPMLATAGFGVHLPGWWSAPTAQLGVRITASTPGQPGRVETGSRLGFDAVAEFRYDVALGGESLSAKELKELARSKVPLMRLRGQWVEVDARRLAAALKVVGRKEQASVGELLRLGLGFDASPDELPVHGVDADGWLGDLLAGRLEHKLESVDPPPSFAGTLRPYQQRGLSWLDFLHRSGLGGVLADDMGLGKTVQLLALLTHDRADGKEPTGPTLLVCPVSLAGNWEREAARFAPDLRVHVHHGKERARGKQFAEAVAAADLVVTTYALVARDAAQLRKIDWHRVVLDEAQAIKNASTKQAVAVRSLPAGSRIAVTGTPVENRLADLWSILEFANPGMLGSASAFKKRYATPIERDGDDLAAQRLRQFTAPFILRRLKTDRSIIADLPEKLEMEVVCNLTTEQAALYEAVVSDMLERIDNSDGIERRGLVLATMTKLKQVCNHPAQFLRDGSRFAGRSGKVDALDEVVEELLAVGDRALLFTQYAEFGSLLRGHLAGRFGREVLFLHGGVGKAQRDRMVARFQDPGSSAPPLFVLSLKAGGTGLTLTAANHVIHVDRWWNPAVEDQATDRAFRIGQTKAVQVRKFVCAGTLEEKISAMIAEKRGLAQRIVGSGEDWVSDLSTAQLAELFRLEEGAVVE